VRNRLLTVFDPPRLFALQLAKSNRIWLWWPFESCDHIDKVISIRLATHTVDPYVDGPIDENS
jgi:hypothetical protein